MLATGQEKEVARIDRVACVEVIAVDVIKGDGTCENPYTPYTQFWTTNNHFIGEIPITTIGNYTMKKCNDRKLLYRINSNGDFETLN